MTEPVLETRGLTLAYGRFVALRNVDLQLLPGQRYGVLGPNGAGKTTLLNLLTGTLMATSGSIHLDGTDITAQPAEQAQSSGHWSQLSKNQRVSRIQCAGERSAGGAVARVAAQF